MNLGEGNLTGQVFPYVIVKIADGRCTVIFKMVFQPSTVQETGAVNIVTGMILDYRAFDTFGESNVLFIATVTVLILLHYTKKDAAGAFTTARRPSREKWH